VVTAGNTPDQAEALLLIENISLLAG